MDVLKWAIQNKTWLFSGAGVAVITAIVSIVWWMITKSSHAQQQSGGIGSRNIQAGRDVNIAEMRPNFFLLVPKLQLGDAYWRQAPAWQ
jgi:hypothetical protein